MIWIVTLAFVLCGFFTAIVEGKTNNLYPLNSDQENLFTTKTKLKSFDTGDDLSLSCISRQIDNGEHKFDANGNIVYENFPVCHETGKPLNFKYGIDEDLTCSIKLTDEIYHLFQLYIHQDAPYTCRLPVGQNIDINDFSIPLNLNFRGYISESHIDIDSNINLLFIKSGEVDDSNDLVPSIISSVGFSSGTNTTRIVIGDTLKLSFAIRWYDSVVKNVIDTELYDLGISKESDLHIGYGNTGFYKLPFTLNYSNGDFSTLRLASINLCMFLVGLLIGIFFIRNRIIKANHHRTNFGGELGKSD